MEARTKAAAQEAAQQQQRRTLAIMRHRQLFSEQARRLAHLTFPLRNPPCLCPACTAGIIWRRLW